MKCTHAQSLMQAFLSHSIADSELGPFLDHIENCRDCREELELYSTVFDTLNVPSSPSSDHQEDHDILVQEKLTAARSYLRRKKTMTVIRRVLFGLLVAAFLVLFYISVLHERIMNSGLFEPPVLQTELFEETDLSEKTKLPEETGLSEETELPAETERR